jgi:adenylosuccinate lyase
MKLNTLNAISPIDGRYHSKTLSYSNFISEYALIKYRVLVDIEYFIALTKTEISSFDNFPKEIIPEIKKI